MPVQKTHITKLKGRKVITVTADQLLAMATSSKNVFRKVPINNPDKPIKRIVMNKNKIILSGTPNVSVYTLHILFRFHLIYLCMML